MIIGISGAIQTNYLFLFLNDLQASRTLMGVSLTFATISEIPIMFFADRLRRRWGARRADVLAGGLHATPVRVFVAPGP